MTLKLKTDSSQWPPGWCPVEHVIHLLEGRWTVLILREMFRGGPCGFRELQRRLDDLSPRTLTDRLQRLEDARLIQRLRNDAGRVEGYALTERGATLAPILQAMIDWSERDRLSPGARIDFR